MRISLMITAAVALLSGATLVSAEPITYMFTGTGSGTIDTTAFTNARFTIIAQADTANVFNYFADLPAITLSTSSIAIEGVGTGAFTHEKIVFVNQTTSVIGFGAPGYNAVLADYVDINDPVFSTYDLTTPLGPITKAYPMYAGFFNIPTTLGNLTMGGQSNVHDVAFVASTSSVVPEPSSLTGLGAAALCLSCLGVWRRRSLRQLSR
jgi:hypothetical protein